MHTRACMPPQPPLPCDALHDEGFVAERQHKTAGLADIFEGMGEGLAEWIVTAPGGEQMVLQMAYFDRARRPVIMDVGPVLDLEDVVGGAGEIAVVRERFAAWPRN